MHHTSLNYLYKKRLTEGAAGLLALLALLTALTACQHDDEVPAPAYEDRYVPLQISIPASEALKRSPGDPGSDPRLPLPDYLYVYTAFTDAAGNTEEVLYSEYSGIRDSWTTDGTGQNVYVYSYTDQINLPLIDGATDAYCYIIASADDLGAEDVYGGLPQPDELSEDGTTKKKSKAAIEAITLSFDNHSISLRDLYSSYNAAEGVVNGAIPVKNYGQKQSEVTGTLHHVAAKVDIQWNFSETFHEAHPNAFLNAIILSGLPQEGYVFKPTQNSTGNEQTLLFNDDGDANAGTAVYGREDTYIFQPGGGTINYQIQIMEQTADKTQTYSIDRTYTPDQYNPDDVAYYRLRVTIDGIPAGSGS